MTGVKLHRITSPGARHRHAARMLVCRHPEHASCTLRVSFLCFGGSNRQPPFWKHSGSLPSCACAMPSCACYHVHAQSHHVHAIMCMRKAIMRMPSCACVKPSCACHHVHAQCHYA
eukprot:1138495-Pelagomonas_calceolata.AAC.3